MPRTPKRVTAPKSAIVKADASSRRRTASGETIHVLRWARWTNAEEWDNEKICESEVCADANSWSEISQCIKDDLEDEVKDGNGTAGAYRSHADAIAARDELMGSKIAEARKDVMGALGISPAQWKQTVKATWIAESWIAHAHARVHAQVRVYPPACSCVCGLAGGWACWPDGRGRRDHCALHHSTAQACKHMRTNAQARTYASIHKSTHAYKMRHAHTHASRVTLTHALTLLERLRYSPLIWRTIASLPITQNERIWAGIE